MKNPTILCSRCGKHRKVSLNPDSRDYAGKVAKRWSTTGVVLYCPDCTKEIKNKTRNYDDVLAAILRWIQSDYECQLKGLRSELREAVKKLEHEFGKYWRY